MAKPINFDTTQDQFEGIAQVPRPGPLHQQDLTVDRQALANPLINHGGFPTRHREADAAPSLVKWKSPTNRIQHRHNRLPGQIRCGNSTRQLKQVQPEQR